ncbi:uncharacterized protein LOC135089487 isoform X2 [Scylla paramamosain]|uniref:uncharacterized protein LOC135089487 isoform X2 n=1 Tax=Scylla paramamosain TaxID=85552 RepID=UPI0030827A55
MAFIRSLAFFVWVFAQVLLVSAQWKDNVDCITFFNTSEVPISGINQIVTVDVDVEELVSVNEELYTLFWDTKNVEEPKIEDSNFTKYFTIDNAVGGLWKVSVKTNLEGLPDYNPIPQGKIDALFIFTKSSDGVGPETCRVTLTHNIIDDNNQRPVPDKINDTLTIEEGFMLNYPIYNFASVVQDKDGTSPNNEFIVMMDPNCPLEATKKSYISGEKAVDVFYQLKRSLDYETEPGPIVCDVTFQDPGTPSSGSTKGTITVIIRNVPDEPPKFSENYYYATVESIVATNTSLIIQPSSISAVDGDSGDITSSVTYTMTNAQGDVDGTTYFKINEVTGEVTLIKDLDTPFLVDHQQVMFFLKASDTSQAIANALLVVTLPPPPTTTTSTTTSSTTTGTSCEPCICTTYTTEEITECPSPEPCTPCPTETTTEFTCPTTPSEVTCTPCPTETTTECICPSTPYPTTPSEGTCTPCPTETTTECICPSTPYPTTPSEGTCTPCPTETTTECICPSTPCPTETTTESICPSTPYPTTPSEGTCTPCPTETTTECICPSTPCPTETTTECICPSTPYPTTPSEGTCTPCPTDTTTECICPSTPCPTETTTECICPSTPCPTTPNEGTESTITWGPDQPTLIFERPSYTGSTYALADKVYYIKVKDIGYEVIYDWSDGYESKKYFNIDSKSGWITVNKGNPPPEGLHELEATAMVKSVHSEHTETKVNIYVMPVPIDQPSILNSLISHTVVEGEEEEDVANITVSQISGKVCITEAQPLEAHERFSVTRQDGRTWILRKTGSLDYEEMQEITMVVEAFEEDIKCPEVSEDISPTLQRSQVLVLINVEDKNDVAPLFDSESMVVAYPTNEALRRAVGPVVSVQAKDSDGPEVKYSITGKAADQFTVNENTGEVFVVKGLDCNPQCEFSVNASDTVNSNRLSVTVLPLGMDHIFTLHMDTTVSEVDEQLTELSQKVGAQISELYVNPAPPATMTWGRRHKREAGMTLEVQVYSLKNYSLMSLDELNSALEGATSPIQAEKFVDEPVFKPEPEDTTGLTAAVAVLGTLLGLVLIAGVGFFVYKKKKGKGSPKPRPPSPPISTLGKVYQNHSFEEDGHDTQRSLGHKTNNSLNGFTSVQVHSTQNGDSPPMHRSPLALPSDSIPLRNIDNQQQAGLRRTNPDAPDYFGSSSPAPPPSFTRTTGSSSPAPPPSTSSSFPIYAEIKKPKDPKPKSTSFPSSSSSSSRPEKNVPLTDFSSNSTEKKPDVPTADYEEVGSSKFSALKSSPPPRRSNRHKSDDDDDENVKEGLAYPGGKHDSDEPGDEKKSVAFKVMVDTKEIEAENKGPAQRKAEAEMLMEANRKKLQEEDNEDEDQEETAKL